MFFAQTSPGLNLLARTSHLLMGGDNNENTETAWPELDLYDAITRLVTTDEDGNLTALPPPMTCHSCTGGLGVETHKRIDYYLAT